MKVDCQRLHDSGSFRPSNPHHIKIWRFWKQVQKNLEIGTSNLEISKVCVKLKKNRLFVWIFFFYLFSPPCCILLLLFSLSSSGQWVAISRVSGSPWDLEAKPWDREMPSQTVSLTIKPWGLKVWFISNVAFHTSWIRCLWGKCLFLPHWIRKEKWRSHKNLIHEFMDWLTQELIHKEQDEKCSLAKNEPQ